MILISVAGEGSDGSFVILTEVTFRQVERSSEIWKIIHFELRLLPY